MKLLSTLGATIVLIMSIVRMAKILTSSDINYMMLGVSFIVASAAGTLLFKSLGDNESGGRRLVIHKSGIIHNSGTSVNWKQIEKISCQKIDLKYKEGPIQVFFIPENSKKSKRIEIDSTIHKFNMKEIIQEISRNVGDRLVIVED